MKISVPARSASAGTRRAQYISPATQSISIVFVPVGGGTTVSDNLNLTVANPNCTSSILTGLACTINLSLPVGVYTVNIATYDGLLDGNSNPTGNVLSQYSIPLVTISSGQTTLVNVTLQGVPATVALVPSATGTLSQTGTNTFALSKCFNAQTVTLIGLDADGNYIVGAGAPVPSLTSSDPMQLSITAPSSQSPNQFTITRPATPTGNATISLNATLSPAAGDGTPVNASFAVTFNSDVCGVVSTFAGNSGAGYDGFRDGTGTNAWFYQPWGLALDAAGNLYVADDQNARIREITPAAVVSTIAGDGNHSFSNGAALGGAEFLSPTGVAVDASGNVIIADPSSYRVRKLSGGSVSTLAGQGGAALVDGTGAAAYFNQPQGVAVDASGTIYVADYNDNAIRTITAGGVVKTLANNGGVFGYQNGPAATAYFNQPSAVAVDGAGNVYVADTQNNAIRKISAGVVSTFAGAPPPTGVAGSQDGTGTAARFFNPYGVTVDSNGNVFVADSGNNAIREITPAGVVTTIAGGQGSGSLDGVGNNAHFSFPIAIVADNKGGLYVSDYFNCTIRYIK
jgi:sugar lactone lactonase YvrE